MICATIADNLYRFIIYNICMNFNVKTFAEKHTKFAIL